MELKTLIYELKEKKISPENAQKIFEDIIVYKEKINDDSFKKKNENKSEKTEKIIEYRDYDNGISVIQMNDKENKNSFTLNMVEELKNAFKKCVEKKQNKVIILRGYDAYFSSGGDITGLLAVYKEKVKLTELDIIHIAIECELPVVCPLEGHAIGSGLSLGLFADFPILSEESYYACNHMEFGFTPGDGATWLLPEKVGKRTAGEMLYTGKRFSGNDLKERGVDLTILPKKDVFPYAMKLANELSSGSRDSLVLLKKHMNLKTRVTIKEVIEKEWEMQEKSFVGNPEALKRIEDVYKSRFPENSPEMMSLNKMINGFNMKELPVKPGNQKKVRKRKVNPKGVISLNKKRKGTPVFWIHGESLGLEGYGEIANKCERPFYGISFKELTTEKRKGISLKKLIKNYAEIITEVQNNGPYEFGGYSTGGYIAYELCRVMQERGQKVTSLMMIDTFDDVALKQFSFSLKSRLLQTVNFTILNRMRRKRNEWSKYLIPRSEIEHCIESEEILDTLIKIGRKNGTLSVKIKIKDMMNMFNEGIRIIDELKLTKIDIKRLPFPDKCCLYYLKNASDSIFSEFEEYFVDKTDQINLSTKYWKKWTEEIPNTKIYNIDAASHYSLFNEPDVNNQIGTICKKLYAISK